VIVVGIGFPGLIERRSLHINLGEVVSISNAGLLLIGEVSDYHVITDDPESITRVFEKLANRYK